MRLLLLLLFFGYSFAEIDITYQQYLNLGSQKNWPKDEAHFITFVNYCNNQTTNQTTESEDDYNFTEADCLLFNETLQTTQITTLSPIMKSIQEPIYNGNDVFNFVTTEESNNVCTMTISAAPTTPPTTTELTTIPTTTEVNSQIISVIEGNTRNNFEEPECDSCLTQTSLSTSSTRSSTLITESSSPQTSTRETTTTSDASTTQPSQTTEFTTMAEANTQITTIIEGNNRYNFEEPNCDNCQSQTSTSTSSSSTSPLITESSSTQTSTPASTSKSTESQELASSSTNPSTVSATTESLQKSTENLEISTTAKTETSTKSTIISLEIPSTTTEIQTEMPSSSHKPTTTLKTTTITKTSTSPPQQAASETEISTKTSNSPTSVKSTKVETTTKSGTSTMSSTKLPISTTTTKSSTVSSTFTAQKTTIKPTTPKKPETTIPENLQTTVQSMSPSTSTEQRVSETVKTSVTSITESATTQPSTSTSTMAQTDTTVVTTPSPSHEKSSTTVIQGASTLLDNSSISSTTSEYSTSTKTIADKISTTSATSNKVTETTTQIPATTSKQQTSTMPGHLSTDTATVPAESVTPKNYPTTTLDVTVVSTTEQALPATTKDNNVNSLETTLQNDEALTTPTANKLPSTTKSPETTTPRKNEISSTKTQTLTVTSSSTALPTKTITEKMNEETSTSTTTVPESSIPTDIETTTTTPITTTTVGKKEIESLSSLSASSTTKLPSTSLPELKTTESVELTTQSTSTKSSDSTTIKSTSSSTTATTVSNNNGNQNDVTSTFSKTTSTLEESISSTEASTPTVPQNMIEEKSNPAFVDQSSTESIKSPTTTLPSITEEDQETASSEMTSDKDTVSPTASTSLKTSTSENRQNTGKSTEEPPTTTKADPSSTTLATKTTPTTTNTSKTTKKATESATQSTVQSTESTTSSSTEQSSTPSPPPSKSTSTKRPTSTTTKSPLCNFTCPPGFSEGDYACFKFILPNATEGAYYDDFLNACISMKGVIASLADFGNIKNVDTFQAMTNAQRPKPSMVYTNAVPTKYHRTTQIVPVIELDEYSLTKMPVIGLSATEKYPNATVICRVGKFCQEYTCPVLEYFIPPTAKYLVATVPPNTVLKAGEKLSVECFGTPQRTFDVKCDERGFLLPDSSMVKCEARNVIKSEPDGPVKSCAECDKLQTTSCEPLPSGEYYCNCKELYKGRTCTYPFNACENVTCQNGGTCENRFTYGFCNCETEFFGSVCQYEFYNSYEAWLMRAMAYTATAVVAAETAVRTKKRLTPSAPGQFASLPTEMCKFYSAIFGSLALACRIMFEFPDSDDLADAVQCGTTFVITMTLAFCSLTAMVAESIIALGVVINATANCYEGHYQERKKCVNNKRLVTFYAIFCIIPFIIFCIFSSDMVTSRSCIGVLPWQGFPDSQQYAGLGLMVLMSAYTLTACGLALAARQVLDHNIFETRRRYEADLADPTAYGREVLPVELNVRYYLLALKPLFFTLVWFSAIAAAERMEWWATYLATICSGIYGVISFVQNKLTVYDELDGLIVKGMNWLPKKFAPKYNYISNRTRNDYLKVGDPEKFAKEQEEKLNGGPAISFPIPFDQNLERLMKTNKPGVLNKGAFFKLVPTGFYKIVIRKWKLEYLKHRVSGLTRGDSLRNVWWDIQNKKVATPMCPFTTFIDMFINFRDNCWHWDRLDDRDPRSKKVLERGVRMLDIKPSIKIPVAKVKNPATDRRVTFFRDDPLMNFEQQQKKFDLLESLCQSFTAEDMSKDEAETAAYVHKYFYYCNKRRSLLTKRINDNRRRTVHDFLLDERRPNFVGPRTFERQIPPGITYLDHTAYYWECLNYETWKRLRIRAKYVELNIELRYEYNHWGDFLPWNWSRYSWDPNMVFDPSKYSPLDLPNIAEADENEEDEEEEEDEDMENAN